MGLSERKQKQKIGLDPRNLAWRHDTTSFGAQMLLKAGHTPGTSLGLSDNGLVNPIAAARKIDSSGIGMGRARREGGVEGGGVGSAGGNLDDLLRRLQAAESGASSDTGSDAPKGKTLSGFARAVAGSGNTDTVVVTEEVTAVSSPGASSSSTAAVLGRPSRMAHRNKFRTAKQLASQNNAAAMSEILGIRSPAPSSPYDSGRESPAQSASEPATPTDELITKNKEAVSVQDYFKAKMEAKKAAMLASIAAAAGGAPLAPLDPAAVAFEEPVVVVEQQQPLTATILPAAEASGSFSDDEASPAPVVVDEKRKKDKGKGKAVDESALGGARDKESEKAEKKRLKREAKEAKRAAKEAAKSSGSTTPAASETIPEPAAAEEETKKSRKSKKRAAPDDEGDAAAAAAAAEKAERKKAKKAKRSKGESEA